jgi:aspartyl-tRNA(Asn)/glutamyl-tRNA(Gln) amidotransferase subunit C
MLIDKATLEKLSTLAKIALKEEEIPYYLESFNKLLGALTALQKVDVSGVPIDSKLSSDRTQYLREDSVTEHPDRELFQKCAAKTAQGFYLVPKVIEGEHE